MEDSLNVLILYADDSTHVSTITEYLRSFKQYSRHHIFYAVATGNIDCKMDINVFDALIIHYSIRINVENSNSSLSPAYCKAIKQFNGEKILFIQDEYEATNNAKAKMLELGITTVYTTVPTHSVHLIYPPTEFKNVEFITVLTGYTSEHMAENLSPTPLAQRSIWIGYRGRELPYWYGHLGREKFLIGKEMKKFCAERQIPADIEWCETKRIYGNQWYPFLASCRATLGTESGSNIFDFTGELRRTISVSLKKNSNVSYEEVFEKYLRNHEGMVTMNQISPKIFEAITLHTALILFEGSYSGVLDPDLHYIALKKDWSNIDEVFAKLADDHYLNKITTQSYHDIILSGKFSYHNFINEFDHHLSQKITQGSQHKIVPIMYAAIKSSSQSQTSSLTHRNKIGSLLTNDVLCSTDDIMLIQHKTNNFHFLTNYLDKLTSSQNSKILYRINHIIPGRPLSKIYQGIKKLLKV